MALDRRVVLALVLGMATLALPALAQSTWAMNKQACEASAAQKNLLGAAHDVFMATCMGKRTSTSPSPASTTTTTPMTDEQQQRARVCNLAASHSNYNSVDRAAFMAKCLNGG